MTASTLLIFDIDGTLIHTTAGRRAFDKAFHSVFGVENATEGLPMAGWTDPAIFERACQRHSLDTTAFRSWKHEFLAHLDRELQSDPGIVLPGVLDLLCACQRESQFVLTLGTGNMEEGARLKLAPHDLNRYFPDGGFGNDGATRNDVIATAVQRASRRATRPVGTTVVIGDTPLDIACGKANGCLTLGVATGFFRADALRACGADEVIESFSDWKQTLQILHTFTQTSYWAAQ